MPSSSQLTVEAASELVRRLCVAAANVSVYTVRHPLALRYIQAAYEWLTQTLADTGSAVVLHFAPERVLVGDLEVETRNPIVHRLAKQLLGLHVNNLSFNPGVTQEEFAAFYEIACMKEEDVAGQGGVLEVFASRNVSHVTVGRAAYVRVGEDERVVSVADTVVRQAEPGAAGGPQDERIVRYLVDQVVERTEDKTWLIDRFKNSPSEMAELISHAVERVLSHPELSTRSDDVLHNLVENIRTVAHTMSDRDDGPGDGEAENLKEALVVLAAELRMRFRSLPSSESAVRFVNELLQVVSAYSDRILADRVADEFLRDEDGLKRTEKLLKRYASPAEPAGRLVERLRDYMLQKGLKEEDIHRLLAVSNPRRRRGPRKKPFDQALRDGIVQRVKSLALPETEAAETAERLATFFANKQKERESGFREQMRQLTEAVDRRDALLDELKFGVVIWTPAGTVEHVNAVARDHFPWKKGQKLRPELLAALRRYEFPLAQLDPDAAENQGLDPDEYRFLLSVEAVVAGADREPLAAFLSSAPA